MIWKLEPIWLALAFGMIAILTFLLGIMVDALVGDEAFGPVGNMMVMMAGFLAAIQLANHEGVAFRGLDTAPGAGLAGAFAALVLLALVTAGLNRL